MRIAEIEMATLDLLYSGRYPEAIHSFRTTCEKYTNCEKISECTERCLLPKLRYMTLSNEDNKLDIIISDLLDLLLIDELKEN